MASLLRPYEPIVLIQLSNRLEFGVFRNTFVGVRSEVYDLDSISETQSSSIAARDGWLARHVPYGFKPYADRLRLSLVARS